MAFHAPTYEDIVNSKYATAMPAQAVLPQTDTRNYFQAVDNLMALRDPQVVKAASHYGDPVELLESFVE